MPDRLRLSSFKPLLNQQGSIRIEDGQPVIAVGQSRGREVVLLDANSVDADERDVARRAFIGALNEEFGPRITDTVKAHLPVASAPLDTELIGRAIQMAETQSDVFGGINFAVELHCSAAVRSAAFRAACGRHGVDAAMLSPAELQAIDAKFRADLASASQGALGTAAVRDNLEPISTKDGENLLNRIVDDYFASRTHAKPGQP